MIASPRGIQVHPRPSEFDARILLIEDDDLLTAGLCRRLYRAGYQVVTAEDGATGIELVARIEPDVVLLDLGLPRMHGFKVLHELRRMPSPVPVLLITGSADPRVDARAAASGVAHVFHKPFALGSVLPVIREICGATFGPVRPVPGFDVLRPEPWRRKDAHRR